MGTDGTLGTYKKAVIFSACVISGTIAGKFWDGKYFGTFEGFVTGLVVGSFVTAYVDANSLPTTTTGGN